MILRVLLDQNVPRAVCAFLQGRRPSWIIRHVADVGLWGCSDAAILQWAIEDSAVVITFDEDFADARMFPVGSHSGVIRLRVWPTTVEQTKEALDRVLLEVPEADSAGSLVIVDAQRIRVRRSIRHG